MSDALDIPGWLSRKLSPAEREAAWAAWPNKPAATPPAPPSDLELRIAASLERDRQAADEITRGEDLRRRQQAAARIEEMHARFAENGGPPPKRKPIKAALRARAKARA